MPHPAFRHGRYRDPSTKSYIYDPSVMDVRPMAGQSVRDAINQHRRVTGWRGPVIVA